MINEKDGDGNGTDSHFHHRLFNSDDTRPQFVPPYVEGRICL